jgi:hypothetical protein
MATLHISDALPLETLLGAIPSLPRPLLSRLTVRLIERMDEMDGDCDLEDSFDRELEGSEDDLQHLVPLRFDPHPDMPRLQRELRRRSTRC